MMIDGISFVILRLNNTYIYIYIYFCFSIMIDGSYNLYWWFEANYC